MRNTRFHRTDVLHGLFAVLAFTVATLTFMLGLHILAMGFFLAGLFWLWPERMLRVFYGLFMLAFTVAMILISVFLPWWLAHKTWVWIFG